MKTAQQTVALEAATIGFGGKKPKVIEKTRECCWKNFVRADAVAAAVPTMTDIPEVDG